MSDETKVVSGQKFCETVDAAKTAQDLFDLAYEVLNSSHSHRNLEQRIGNTEIPSTNAARHIRAEIARKKAEIGHNLSTAEKLTVLIDAFYEKGFDKKLKKTQLKADTMQTAGENSGFATLLNNYDKNISHPI